VAEAPQPPTASPADRAIPEDQDYLFRASVATSEFLLKNWKYGGWLLGAVLLGSLAWGLYGSYRASVLAEQYDAIADIDFRMPALSQRAMYGMGPKDDPADSARKATLEEGARRYAAAARAASGSAAVYAWLKSAESWERAQNPEEQRKAVEAATQVGAGDLAGFVADSAWVGLLLAESRAAEAEAALTAMADRYSGLYAEEALLRLAGVQADAGATDKAKATVESLKKRFPTPVQAESVDALAARLGMGT
jgi:hypothetical protein